MSLTDNLLLGFAVASLLISIGAIVALIVMQPGLCFVVVAGLTLISNPPEKGLDVRFSTTRTISLASAQEPGRYYYEAPLA